MDGGDSRRILAAEAPEIAAGAESLDGQLARQFRATVALTGVASAIGMMFLAIFAGFGRPDVGAMVLGVLLVPVVVLAWADFAVLRGRVSSYQKEDSSSRTSDAPTG